MTIKEEPIAEKEETINMATPTCPFCGKKATGGGISNGNIWTCPKGHKWAQIISKLMGLT
jgi:ribosomal protein L37AE/L43A